MSGVGKPRARPSAGRLMQRAGTLGLAIAGVICGSARPAAGDDGPTFQTLVLSEEFCSEGACCGDLDRDGHIDIVSGPYWYRGPEFRERRAYTAAEQAPGSAFADQAAPHGGSPIEGRAEIAGYSKYFFCWVDDCDGDGWLDIITVDQPGRGAYWHRNPAANGSEWATFRALSEVSNESPALADLNGDGRRDLVCLHGGAYGYAQADRDRPESEWPFTPVTPPLGYGPYTHGLGVGDVDGDGREDLLESQGWWRQGEAPGELFAFHPQRFAETGGSQMFAYDFDGDGDRDVVAVQNAHAWGLAWFEQRDGRFAPHTILDQDPAAHPSRLRLSQMHALALADLDGDGIADLVTGKRFWAHGGRDPARLNCRRSTGCGPCATGDACDSNRGASTLGSASERSWWRATCRGMAGSI